jgi:hypothetical protein
MFMIESTLRETGDKSHGRESHPCRGSALLRTSQGLNAYCQPEPLLPRRLAKVGVHDEFDIPE